MGLVQKSRHKRVPFTEKRNTDGEEGLKSTMVSSFQPVMLKGYLSENDQLVAGYMVWSSGEKMV